MNNRNIIRISLVGLIVLIASILTVRSIPSATTTKKTCKESMEECCKKASQHPASTNMLWETLSGQFFSSADISE